MASVERAVVLCSLMLGAMPLAAHHSTANFDTTRTLEFRATVTKFEYTNPHAHLYLERVSPEGVKEQWVVEMGSIPSIRSSGITAPDKLKVGDVITFQGAPDKDASKKYILFGRATKEDGTVFGRDRAAAPSRSAALPTTPGSKDFSGVWSNMGSSATGGRAFFDLVNYDVTDRGKTQLAAFKEEDDPALECEKHGVPRSIYGPYPRRITRTANTIEFHYEFLDVSRTVYLNQKTHPTNGKRTHIGHSIGWFEGDTLVVDTANFAAQKWGNGRGLDSSDQKRLIERYTLGDNGNTMTVVFTLTDPVYLSKPAVETHKFRYTPDYRISDFNCDINSAQTFAEQAKKK
jgi:hypothetical protein